MTEGVPGSVRRRLLPEMLGREIPLPRVEQLKHDHHLVGAPRRRRTQPPVVAPLGPSDWVRMSTPSNASRASKSWKRYKKGQIICYMNRSDLVLAEEVPVDMDSPV